ncbi:putative exocyst complex component Sec10 [Helianthus anomalus]
MAVFPSPNDVMSSLVQRVMEDRVPKLLEKLLLKPSLVHPPPMGEGGLLLHLRMLAVSYEKTQELAKDLRSMEELLSESQLSGESTGSIGRSKRGFNIIFPPTDICYSGYRVCALERRNNFKMHFVFTSANVKTVFTCLLDQVSQYTTEGLERARDDLTEVAALRERFVLGTSVSRRVVAVAASAAEAVAAGGESSFRSFMVVQRCGSSVAGVKMEATTI